MGFRAPMIGDWYTDLNSRQVFEIVAFDDQDSTVEVQYVDGEVSQFDMESWRALNLEMAAPPEDWAASYEVAREDTGYSDFNAEVIDDPIAMLEPESIFGFDDF